MGIEKKPFTRYTLGEKPKIDSFTIWLNEIERKELETIKKLIQQPKDSTAFKQLFHYAYLKLIGDISEAYILAQVIRNSYNNRKIGIAIETPDPVISDEKTPEKLTE